MPLDGVSQMAFPICGDCASSGALCPECEKRVRAGSVSELDVLVSSILSPRGVSGYGSLRDLGTKLVIFASDEEVPEIIGVKGKTAAELSRKLGRRIVVLATDWDPERIIRSLARPNRLVAINRVYREDGGEVTKLIFDKALDEDTIRLMRELVGEVEVTYEKDAHVRGAER